MSAATSKDLLRLLKRKCRICTRAFNFGLWGFKKIQICLIISDCELDVYWQTISSQKENFSMLRFCRWDAWAYRHVWVLRIDSMEMLVSNAMLLDFSVVQYQPSVWFLLILYFSTFNFPREVMLVQHGISASILEFFIFIPSGCDSVCLLLH